MKNTFLCFLPLAIAATMAFKSIDGPLPIGAAIPNPEIKMKDISGTEVSFRDAMKKNGLMVMFSCNTCPVVKGYQARTLEVTKYALANNIGVILLNSNEATRSEGDSFEDMKTYAKKQGYTFNYAVDNNSVMADAFGANRTPEIFMFDKDGKLAYHGAIDDNSISSGVTRKHAIVAIDELVAGKAIGTQVTRSVGCTIKRRD